MAHGSGHGPQGPASFVVIICMAIVLLVVGVVFIGSKGGGSIGMIRY